MCARILSLLALLAASSVRADTHLPVVTLIYMQHYVEQEALKVNARVRVKLSDTMIEAARHGIPLFFTTRFVLQERIRLMGLWPLGRTAAELSQTIRLSWSLLDRRWWLRNLRTGRVASSGTLQEALEILGTFSDIPLAPMTELHPGVPYTLRLRLRLDSLRLPPPLWLRTLFDPAWRLDSGWIEEPIDERKLWQR